MARTASATAATTARDRGPPAPAAQRAHLFEGGWGRDPSRRVVRVHRLVAGDAAAVLRRRPQPRLDHPVERGALEEAGDPPLLLRPVRDPPRLRGLLVLAVVEDEPEEAHVRTIGQAFRAQLPFLVHRVHPRQGQVDDLPRLTAAARARPLEALPVRILELHAPPPSQPTPPPDHALHPPPFLDPPLSL